MFIRHPIKPIKGFIRTPFLFDMQKPAEMPLTQPVQIIALLSYPGHYLTADILTEQGALFSYVPFHALGIRPIDWPIRALPDVCYHKCPSEDISVVSNEVLKQPLRVFDQSKNCLGLATYHATVDWYKGNDLLHIISLQGQLMAWPSHKLLWTEYNLPLPEYKKLHQEWK